MPSSSACLSTLQKLGEGKRREINWQAMAQGAITAFNTDTTTRGFTGHEMIDSVGLIHMNGRVYDPTLGRFLSADPNVQALDNLQNFNRYSYVLNNPLSYTDPTGFFFAKLFKAIGKAIGKLFQAIGRALKKLLRSPIVRAIIQIVACAGPQATVTCAIAAGAMAAAGGGSMADVFKAVAFSFISKAVWGAVGAIKNVGKLGMALIHGVVNGALTVAQGGNFLVGFATGVVGKAASFVSDVISKGNMLLDTFIVAAAGCASAVISGGKCANGAISAAFANMYNKWRTFFRSAGATIGGGIGFLVGGGASLVCDAGTGGACVVANPTMIIVSTTTGSGIAAVVGDFIYDVGEKFAGIFYNDSGEVKPDTTVPGEHAGESIPARGPERDFTKEERDEINRIGADTGCHTCGSKDSGTKSGNFVPDHQPPSQLNPDGGPQRLYPHCISCSRSQGGTIRQLNR